MENHDYNKAENAVDNAKDGVKDAANTTKWKVEDYAQRAKDYINEERNNDREATHEGWLDRAKNNVSDAWESTKDAANDAWEKTKDLSVDAEAEVKKATN